MSDLTLKKLSNLNKVSWMRPPPNVIKKKDCGDFLILFMQNQMMHVTKEMIIFLSD